MRDTHYINWYNSQNYDRLLILAPKGTKEKVKEAARASGKSMNEFLKSLIPSKLIGEREYIGRRALNDDRPRVEGS